jgi:histidinol dehydrogenase
MRRLDAAAPDFPRRLAELLDFAAQRDPEVPVRVAAIIADVRARGDAALLEHTNRLDARSAATVTQLEVPASGLAAALERVPAPVREALLAAA